MIWDIIIDVQETKTKFIVDMNNLDKVRVGSVLTLPDPTILLMKGIFDEANTRGYNAEEDLLVLLVVDHDLSLQNSSQVIEFESLLKDCGHNEPGNEGNHVNTCKNLFVMAYYNSNVNSGIRKHKRSAKKVTDNMGGHVFDE